MCFPRSLKIVTLYQKNSKIYKCKSAGCNVEICVSHITGLSVHQVIVISYFIPHVVTCIFSIYFKVEQSRLRFILDNQSYFEPKYKL